MGGGSEGGRALASWEDGGWRLLSLLPFFLRELFSSRFFSSLLEDRVYLPSQIQGMSSQHVTYSSQDVKENNHPFK